MPNPIPSVTQDRLWEVLEQLPIALYVKDTASRFVFVNAQCCQSLNISDPRQAIGKTDRDFFISERAEEWIRQEQAIMKSGDSVLDVEEMECWRDGRRTWALTSKLPLRDGQNNVVGLLGTSKDITRLQQTSLAVAGARDGLWYRVPDTDTVWFSPRWKEILGYSDDELGNDAAEFQKRVWPEDWPRVKSACDKHFSGDSPYYECEFRMRNRDGTWTWVRSRGKLQRDSDGRPVAFAGSHTDMTHTKELERFYSTVLDALPNLIFVKDHHFRFVFVNQALANNFGLTKDQIRGKTDAQLNDDPAQVRHFRSDDLFVLTYGMEKKAACETLTDNQGATRILRTTKLPLKFPGGTDTHVLGVATDITDLEETRRDLYAATERQDALRLFIERARHAITSPLQGASDRALQLIDMLKSDELCRSRIEPLVLDLLDFTRAAGEVLHRFMSGAQVGAMGPRLIFDRHSVGEIVAESVRRLRHSAERRNITIDTSHLQSMPKIECDCSHVAEVFDNLIDNAVKYAREGTTIRIRGETSDSAESWTLPCPGQRYIIKNRGTAIPENACERVFQRYERGNVQPRGRVVPGTGLGLYICREIIKAHGGAITCCCESLDQSHSHAADDCDVAFIVDLPSGVVKE